MRELARANATQPIALALADPAFPSGRPSLGPLAGTFGLVKDDIAVAGLPLTCGSAAIADWQPHRDAQAITLLRSASAMIAGKANLSEWAGGRSSRQVRGWSSLGGQLGHPLDHRYSAGGSSSGSAVAVAMGLVDWALGSETVGSVVQPASLNGVFGIKPTLGTVSTDGLVPHDGAIAQTTIGVLAQRPDQLARVLAVISASAVPDWSAASTALPDRLTLITTAPPDCADLWTRIVERLTDVLGRHRVDVQALRAAIPAGPLEVMQQLLSRESGHYLNRFLATLPPSYPNSLGELIDFNRRHRSGHAGYDDQEWFEAAAAAPALSDDDLASHRAARSELRRRSAAVIDAWFDHSGGDFLIGITERPAWKIDPDGPDPEPYWLPALACASGYPHLSVPGVVERGWPVGVSVMGRPGTDMELIRIGAALRQLLTAAR